VKVAWSEVCSPKQEGGLGLRSIAEANKVCVLKLIWRILSARRSLWVELVKKYLIRRGSFWLVKENTTCGSWIWKKILKYRDTAKSFYRVEVRNGEASSFGFDRWSEMGCLYDRLGARGCIDLGSPMTATVGEVMAGARRRKYRVAILNQVENEIVKQKLIRSNETDVALWNGKHDHYRKEFHTKETWLQIRTAKLLMENYNGIWFKHSTPKYSLITWLVQKNRVATGDKLIKWNPQVTPNCILCQHTLETWDHLFFMCPYSFQVWTKLAKGILHASFTANWTETLKLIHDNRLSKTKCFIVGYIFQNAIHSL